MRLLAEAGASGCSIEDWNPAAGRIEDVGLAAERVAEAAEAAHGLASSMVLTGRAENHLHGVDDLDGTISRLVAYRDAGADCVYAPGLTTLEQVSAVVEAVGVPVNVLALPAGPPIRARPRRRAARLDRKPAGVRRVRRPAAAARELLGDGTSSYAAGRLGRRQAGRVRLIELSDALSPSRRRARSGRGTSSASAPRRRRACRAGAPGGRAPPGA